MGPLYRKLWRGALLRERGPELVAALHPGARETLTVPPGAAHLEAALRAAELRARTSRRSARSSRATGRAITGRSAGSRTASGKPLVAGDPHRPLEIPNVYWQNHVRCAGFDAIGLSFAGVPGFPHFAHNAHVAWCITHGMADDQDLFVERLGARELASAERRSETVVGARRRSRGGRGARDRARARGAGRDSRGDRHRAPLDRARGARLDVRLLSADARREQRGRARATRCASGSLPATT